MRIRPVETLFAKFSGGSLTPSTMGPVSCLLRLPRLCSSDPLLWSSPNTPWVLLFSWAEIEAEGDNERPGVSQACQTHGSAHGRAWRTIAVQRERKNRESAEK